MNFIIILISFSIFLIGFGHFVIFLNKICSFLEFLIFWVSILVSLPVLSWRPIMQPAPTGGIVMQGGATNPFPDKLASPGAPAAHGVG